jgi:hypothetical protein
MPGTSYSDRNRADFHRRRPEVSKNDGARPAGPHVADVLPTTAEMLRGHPQTPTKSHNCAVPIAGNHTRHLMVDVRNLQIVTNEHNGWSTTWSSVWTKYLSILPGVAGHGVHARRPPGDDRARPARLGAVTVFPAVSIVPKRTTPR